MTGTQVRKKRKKRVSKLRRWSRKIINRAIDRLFLTRLRRVIFRLSRRKRYELLAYGMFPESKRTKRLLMRDGAYYFPTKNQMMITEERGTRLERWKAIREKELMGSKGLKQNLDVVGINTRVEKTTEQRARERRQAELDAAAQRDAPNPEVTRLSDEVSKLSEIILNLRVEGEDKDNTIKALQEEVAKLSEKLNKATGSEEKLPDVIGEKDLDLENTPAVARQLPETDEEEETDEETSEEETGKES